MKHYKYWEDEDGYVRGATWDDEAPTINTLMFDPLAETRCGGAHFYHGGTEGAKEAFARMPGDEISEKVFLLYIKPFAGFRQLGGKLAEG